MIKINNDHETYEKPKLVCPIWYSQRRHIIISGKLTKIEAQPIFISLSKVRDVHDCKQLNTFFEMC